MAGKLELAGKAALRCGLALALLVPLGGAQAKFKSLYSFKGGNDGANPEGNLVRDKAGNLFGTTHSGGVNGGGVVFTLSAKGKERVLHSFAGGNDGVYPNGGLVEDKKGHLYGTTGYGGGSGCSGAGCGIVFKVASDGTESILYTFTGGSDGGRPNGSLLADKAGDLYGTTVAGGYTGGLCYSFGCGSVFKLAPGGTETVLYYFTSGNDGQNPNGGLIADTSGNFYGTTEAGGPYDAGTIFKLAANGTETVLYAFDVHYSTGIGGPLARVTRDGAGDLFTTVQGGLYGGGAVFELAADGTANVVYSFCAQAGCSDGESPASNLILDKSGNLYGTAGGGGAHQDGVIFKLTPGGTETVLHSFRGSDGSNPTGGLLSDGNHNLYGTAYSGGKDNNGTVYKK
jgi:uncharacterized repeat protein (TIGR03803 family)